MSLLDDIKQIGQLGGFGDIVFTVNPLSIMSPQKITRKRAIEVTEHKIIGTKPKLEVTGEKLDEVTIELLLSSWLGVKPNEEVQKFADYMKTKTRKMLIIGNGLQGANVWGEYMITDMNETYEEIDSFGQITKIGLTVSFLEYN